MLSALYSRWQLFHPSIRLQLINAGLLGFTLDGGIYTVLLNLYMLRLDFGPALIGQVNGVGMFVFAAVSLPAGTLGERWSLWRMMLYGMALMTLGAILIPMTDLLAPQWHAIWLIIANVLINIGLASYYANSPAFAIGHTTASNSNQSRASIFGIQSAFYSIFGFLGSLIGGNMPQAVVEVLGGRLDQPAPYRVPLIVAAAILVLALFLVTKMQEPILTEVVTPSATLGAPSVVSGAIGVIVIMSLIRFFQVSGVATINTFFNVYMDQELHVSTATIGTVQSIAKLIGVPAALSVPYFVRRLGAGHTGNWASILVVLGLLPIIFVPYWSIAALSYILVWGVTPIRYSAFIVYIMERVPQQLRGSMSGAGEMAAGLSFALIALTGGYVITWAGYSTLFVIGALATLLGTLLFWWYEARR